VVTLPTALAAILTVGPVAAQTGEVDGTVRGEDGAPVYAASVMVGRTGEEILRGTETDRGGYFRITDLAPGAYVVRASRLGYGEASREITVRAGERTNVDLVLPEAVLALEGFSVEAERSRDRARFEEEAGATVRELSADQLRAIPGLAEKDPLRAIEVLPGVVSTSDFTSAFNVRGGSADQNLILLDGVPIFNPFHLGGLFSVFNGDMVSRAELLSGGFPARYGGRVSSVLTVETDAGTGDFSVDAGISLLSTRVAVGGGVGEGVEDALGLQTARWRVSGRRSYFDVVLQPVVDFPYALTDLQGILEAWTPGGSRLAISAYTGSDRVDFSDTDNEDFPLRVDWGWGNDVLGVSWSKPWSGGGGVELRSSYSRFENGLRFPDFEDTDLRSAIQQVNLAAELRARAGEHWSLRGGLSGERYEYDNNFETGGTTFAGSRGDGWLVSGFAQGEWQRGMDWIVELGVRAEHWTRETSVNPVLAPRVAMKRFLGDGSGAVKVAAGRFSQFLHSVRDEEIPLGIDIWVLSGDRAPTVVSDQVQGGVEWFLGDRWFVSLEGYARTFEGVISVNQAEDPNDPLDDFLEGEGHSYGADLFVRRDGPGVSGWLTVSWLRAERTFPDPLQGIYPPPESTIAPIFDRRLDVDLVLRVPMPWGVEGGIRWNLGTGLPYTRPLANYGYYSPELVSGGLFNWEGQQEADDFDPGGFGFILGPRNGERYPAYHRLDLSLRKTFQKSWGSIVPYLDVLNVYNRRNVLFYFYELEKNPAVRSGVSMFPVLPSFGVEIR
jgi:hypothetical protein